MADTNRRNAPRTKSRERFVEELLAVLTFDQRYDLAAAIVGQLPDAYARGIVLIARRRISQVASARAERT